ncbi:short-chain fatty acid transporter [Tissierella praeacuta]|uniref:short-chain fatty acid transporter n=1 Tax=Tissierella praeacuta TaxID=43131 RepID=UPI0028AB6B8F|nr:short-chain fatty acid transporter [Tissierella praeacuta]
MFKKLTNVFVSLVQKYLPDAFLFAIFLTIITLVLGVAFTGQSLLTMVNHWGNGVWALLAFSMQMALVLVTGHTLASSKVFKGTLKRMAKLAKTPTQAIMAVSFVSAVACWINWGFGLVIGALYAKELAKEVDDVDYRLLIASAYSGFLVWHGGISASIPLTLATDAATNAAQTRGAIDYIVPTTQTIFSTLNLIISGVLVLTLPLINRAMHPERRLTVAVDKNLLVDLEEGSSFSVNNTPADKVENNPIVNIIVFMLGMTYIVMHFINKGFDLNLNIVNLIFLTFGILFHRTPRRFIHAFGEAAKGAGPILLQFPFYAGIMGMMTGTISEGASLAGVISNWFVSISTERTFPLFTFWAAGIVNFFVPSGGGQWAVQAPIMMPAGLSLGVPAAKTAIAIAWGDAWTNMIQPFWALPALGIAGLGARDIMGFCLMDLLYSGVVISLALLLL